MAGLLALDPATVCGFAFCRPGEQPIFGKQRMGRQGCSLGEALATFRRFLEEHIESGAPDRIVFEAPYIPLDRKPRIVRAGTEVAAAPRIPMNADVVRKLMCMQGVIEEVGYVHGIPVSEATPMQISKFFTGRGRWGSREEKKAATVRICRLYGYDVTDDNEADALALLFYAESKFYPAAASGRKPGPLFASR